MRPAPRFIPRVRADFSPSSKARNAGSSITVTGSTSNQAGGALTQARTGAGADGWHSSP
jgi:hypothetical protein